MAKDRTRTPAAPLITEAFRSSVGARLSRNTLFFGMSMSLCVAILGIAANAVPRDRGTMAQDSLQAASMAQGMNADMIVPRTSMTGRESDEWIPAASSFASIVA